MRHYLRGGLNALSADEMRVQTARYQNAMSTGVGEEGGYTVAQEYVRELQAAMKLSGGMRSVATVLQTETGAKMLFPATDATAEMGEVVGENASVSNLDTRFSQLSLDVFKYSSKSIALPFELLQDSMFDLEAYIRSLLAARIGRITNKHFTVGTGSGQPNGLVTAAKVGKVGATGTATSITYDDLVDLEHSVDPIYRLNPNVGFMMHDSTLQALRKIKDADGRPIFVPGYEQGNPQGAPDRLLGRPIFVNQDMPVMAANAKSVAFGDFSKYVVRDVLDLTLFRMADSYYVQKGQIGFLAFARSGGNLIDVGGAVKVFQNSAS